MDLTPLDGKRKRTFGAVYMRDADSLWIADNQGIADRPHNFDLSAGIADPLRVTVLRRQPAKAWPAARG